MSDGPTPWRRYYTGRDVERALDIPELRAMARRRLPMFVREYLEVGADTESTLRRNRRAFDDYRWVHKVAIDVTQRSLATNILGVPSALPFAVGPTGFNGILWRRGDIALARAAKHHGVPFITSMVASERMENIIAAAGGNVWFQITLLTDPRLAAGLVERVDAAGCEVLVVTLDEPTLGSRTWNDRQYAGPLQLKLRSKLDVLAHLRWLFGVFLPKGLPGFGNLTEFLPAGHSDSPIDGARLLDPLQNAALTWADLARLRDRWKRKLVLKGLLHPDDVGRAVALGADGVVLSNHGGRQLDSGVAPLDVLPEIAAAHRDKISILIDGGFRSGGDVAKALALGAHAVLLGRSLLYGLAAGGEPGARRALEIFRLELERLLTLLGCASLADLGPSLLRRHTNPN